MKKLFAATVIFVLLILNIAISADVFDLGAGYSNLDTVAIGDVGNTADTTGYGSVNYIYNIGKYEVTAKQYTDFLNNKAKSDPYGLYNSSMWDDEKGCRIQRLGNSGSYSYTVTSDYANRPVNFVSFWDCCRFANWISNGQGDGSTETGTYTIPSEYNGTGGVDILRNSGWKWAVASEDEWYKAAYYKHGGTNMGYWIYATQSDTAPSHIGGARGYDVFIDPGNHANYFNWSWGWDKQPYYRTIVGEYENSASAYGTFDQNGNVEEWNDTVRDWYGYGFRVIRGGSFYQGDLDGLQYLKASKRRDLLPTDEHDYRGFRMSSTGEATNYEVSSVLLNKSSLSIGKGNAETLIATVLPYNAANKTITWSSSNTAAVTVNSTGLIMAIDAGSSIITVTTVDGGYTANCSVNVVYPSTVIFPQITDGIYNQNGALAMKCMIGADGLTITDEVWDTYNVQGYKKRWTFNMGKPMNVPLKNYRFNDKFSGLPLNITVEFYLEAQPWIVVENYQEIIQLGGKQQIGLPEWFHIPTNRLGYDFDEGNWFPSGWSVPEGKFACWQGAAKVYQQDKDGKHPMFDYGFNYIAQCAKTVGGVSIARDSQCQLFTDNEWITGLGEPGNDPTNPANWMIQPWKSHAEQSKLVIVDFEACRSDLWGDSQFQAFSTMVNEVKTQYPDVYFGCWAQAPCKSSFRIFDRIINGIPQGGEPDLIAAQQWADFYSNPQSQINNTFERISVNFSNPGAYYVNNSKPSLLYAFLQEWELSKKIHPDVPTVLSSWIQVEFLDGYPLSSYKFKDSNGIDRIEMIKHQVPASSVYALSLFAHTVMDGLYSWETGTKYSENINDYADTWHGEMPKMRNVNGIDTYMWYYIKYFGFYNYHVLGMWQASQNKSIIEADTKWEMPEIWTDKNKTWRINDERYPSFVNYFKEPLARVKLSKDGKTMLIVADNPYNMDVEKVKIRYPGTTREYEFELVGDFPIIKSVAVPAIEGTVILGNYSGLTTGLSGLALIRDSSNEILETHKIVLDEIGKFSFSTNLTGTYKLSIKISHWLSTSTLVTIN